MSTQLESVSSRNGEVLMTRFWGGKEDGVCLQLTSTSAPDYIQLNRDQVMELMVALDEFLAGTRKELE